jgi:transposase
MSPQPPTNDANTRTTGDAVVPDGAVAVPGAVVDPAQLPDDPDVLRRMIIELLSTLHERDRRVGQLEHRLDQLLRQLYGPRAERVDAAQLKLFAAELLAAQEQAAAEAADTEPEPAPTAPPGKRPGHGRRRLPENLRRERVEHELSQAERLCPCCGQDRTRIGEEVSEQLEYRPASMFVIEHVRAKYTCRHCQENPPEAPPELSPEAPSVSDSDPAPAGDDDSSNRSHVVVIADKPSQPIAKGLPGPGLLAHLSVCKFHEHMPLNRCERRYAREGVHIPRSTLCGWVMQSADLLRPLFALMGDRVRQSKVVHTDDTPVPVQDKSRDKTRRGRFWVYIGDEAHPYTVFDYTPSRARDGPVRWLAGFKGYLQADAFAGYDGIYASGGGGDVIEVACWAHGRRKFYDARLVAPGPAHTAIAYVRQLYNVEDLAKRQQLNAEQRGALRREKSRPMLDQFHTWLRDASRDALPKSPMGQAIGYALNQWDALYRYTDDGDLAIDNNVSERAMRRVALGRKNFTFLGADAGGRAAAVHYSFAATVERHGLNAWLYLRDVISRIGDTPLSQLDSLLPDRWQADQAAK